VSVALYDTCAQRARVLCQRKGGGGGGGMKKLHLRAHLEGTSVRRSVMRVKCCSETQLLQRSASATTAKCSATTATKAVTRNYICSSASHSFLAACRARAGAFVASLGARP